MSTRLFIVRHAEHVKPGDDHLSKIGSLQAAALAETFKSSKTKYDAIYSSSRCHETAELIASALGLHVIIDERLRNWDGGVVKGLSKDEVREKHPEVYQNRFLNRDPNYQVPEGETLQQRFDRVQEFLNDVVATGPSPSTEPKQIIVVTHGGIIDDIFRATCHISLVEKVGLNKPFGCVSALLHENGNWKDEHWARADHLPRVVAESPSGGHLYLFPNQVSGSFPMLRGDRGELCKPATPNELAAYIAIFVDPATTDEIKALQECLPKYLGTVDVDVESILHETTSTQHSASPSISSPPVTVDSLAGSAAGPVSSSSSPTTLSTLSDLQLSETSPGADTAVDAPTTRRPLQSRKSFSVQQLWNRFITDRWLKLARSADAKRCVYLILENVTHGMHNPNVMDCKVGTRQHRDNETEAKQKRKEERCKQSTSASLGLRIHGISMYSPMERKMVLRDKYWGRSLDDSGVFTALREFIHTGTANPSHIVSSIVSRLELFISAVKNVTWRFYGSSILIVFNSQEEFPQVQVRMIDFGSCDMNTEGKYSGYDAGFVFGLENLIVGFNKAIEEGVNTPSSRPVSIATRSTALSGGDL
jgi:inositol-hexakisphosphate kinase